MTISEIKEELDTLGIDYDDKAKKDELLALLEQANTPQQEEAAKFDDFMVYRVVSDKKIRIRENPSIEADTIGVINPQELFVAKNEDIDGWVTVANGGYCMSSLVEKID